jgi:hypothetical protein
MTLRVHYEMTALEAFATAKQNRETLGIGTPGGLMGRLRAALCS